MRAADMVGVVHCQNYRCSRWSRINAGGLIKFDCPISSPNSLAENATRKAVTSGRILPRSITGRSIQAQRNVAEVRRDLENAAMKEAAD